MNDAPLAFLILLAAAACALGETAPATTPSPAGEPEQIDVFTSGTEGYHTFRIPAAVVTLKGTVLAFAEGRRAGAADSGDIDIVLRRSTDGGRTWLPMQTVWDDGPNTCSGPCAVVDRDTGTVWMVLAHNLVGDTERKILDDTSKATPTVWVTHSTDDGVTWAKPAEITATARKPNWTWYATGPGVGIQLRSGRLLMPCDTALAGSKAYYSHVLVSDDHGKTWRLGGVLGPGMNECQAVERADGQVLLNMRNYDKSRPNRRAVATSDDGGLTWSPVAWDDTLVEPVCQASILRVPAPARAPAAAATPAPGPILFSNPASTKREKLTIRLSRDEARTWPVSRVLWAGPAAYSCLAALPDGTIGCLYERGQKGAYEKITWARFGLAWLEGAKGE